MQTYRCTCGNRLFFENTVCVVCNSEVGWCEPCGRVTALQLISSTDGSPATYHCGYSDCGKLVRKCHNYVVENVCNRCYEVQSENLPAALDANGANTPD